MHPNRALRLHFTGFPPLHPSRAVPPVRSARTEGGVLLGCATLSHSPPSGDVAVRSNQYSWGVLIASAYCRFMSPTRLLQSHLGSAALLLTVSDLFTLAQHYSFRHIPAPPPARANVRLPWWGRRRHERDISAPSTSTGTVAQDSISAPNNVLQASRPRVSEVSS